MAGVTDTDDIREAVRERYAAAARSARKLEATECCDADELSTCCEPAAKSDCCGSEAASTPSSCGCR